eukprot:CAMPEP_0197527570 /NCGR_PEP_ID=MMETSP1318-20131121/22158_1 /TAXON_ID=552666 /ORGANISM="Partenskyella glossopodia, Strain RCC365" /LENGTH=355 /DNA_ID=CAMNT_0043082293 /DNA_START=17 /DNA_END=1081 /DNA_ORIENTATION=+
MPKAFSLSTVAAVGACVAACLLVVTAIGGHKASLGSPTTTMLRNNFASSVSPMFDRVGGSKCGPGVSSVSLSSFKSLHNTKKAGIHNSRISIKPRADINDDLDIANLRSFNDKSSNIGQSMFGIKADSDLLGEGKTDMVPAYKRGDEALEAARNAKELWIFAYGKDMWDPSFEGIVEKRDGWVKGFLRRFYGVSSEKYGSSETPGRVLTMVETPGAFMWGYHYRIADEHRETVLETLAKNAENGAIPRYHQMGFAYPSKEGGGIYDGHSLAYVIEPDSASFSELEDPLAIAKEIYNANGSQGANAGYLLGLYNTLGEIRGFDRNFGFAIDQHVNEIVDMLPLSLTKQMGFNLRKW